MALDRRKQDFDVMERVLGSVRDEYGADRTDLVRLDVQSWMAGTTTSVVQMTVMGGVDDVSSRSRRMDR